MSDSKKDEAYERGVQDGLDGGFLDDLSRSIPVPSIRDTDDTYDKGYDWGREHRYDPKHSDRGCFISSACAQGQSLSDDCHELQVLRAFRDRLTEEAAGRSAVEEYYRDAPQVVASIDASPNPKAVYGDLYQRLVRRCVDLIEQGKSGEAFDTYRRIFYELKQQYAT